MGPICEVCEGKQNITRLTIPHGGLLAGEKTKIEFMIKTVFIYVGSQWQEARSRARGKRQKARSRGKRQEAGIRQKAGKRQCKRQGAEVRLTGTKHKMGQEARGRGNRQEAGSYANGKRLR